ncbi:MAG: HAD hydrolase-like protein [SAR324 cluster bacterium]|nr:HAD hydrolase-like protein [SAR324 cluster bacterium]
MGSAGLPSKLVLFDIDGTLLTTNGQAVESMLAAVQATYGVEGNWQGVRFNGRTERWIVLEMLAAAGLERGSVERGLPEFWRAYVAGLRRRLKPEQVTVFPGVRELLALLVQRKDIVLGLLTGNIAASAQVKLAVAGLEGFVCGAFGEHHEAREELPAVAVHAAAELCGTIFKGGAIVIIGDTPNDIACGRHLQVNSIAVATGKFSVEELRRHDPRHLFPYLRDTAAVLRAIESGGGTAPQDRAAKGEASSS